MATKRCPQCRVDKPRTGYSPCVTHWDGLQSYCKTCRADNARRYRVANADRVRTADARRRAEHVQERRDRTAVQQWMYRRAAIASLGGKCAQCGSTDRLEIDHVDGDGKAHRREVERKCYIRQLALGVYTGPPLQVLCYDHHRAKSNQELSDLAASRRGAS